MACLCAGFFALQGWTLYSLASLKTDFAVLTEKVRSLTEAESKHHKQHQTQYE